MELKLERHTFTDRSTLGDLSIDGEFECHTLEDTDRKIEDNGCSAKVYGETCIPRGNYTIDITYSPHFGKAMPLIENVPCFEGIRIHIGNRPEDTEGCVLLGTKEDDDFIEHSRDAFNAFLTKLQDGLKEGEVTIEIV
jgi:hypothetical protein